MVSTGLSDVIGSWKIIDIRLPRIRLIWAPLSLSRSCPSKITSPPTILPGGEATSLIMESALTVFPHPLSPTMPIISPSLRS